MAPLQKKFNGATAVTVNAAAETSVLQINVPDIPAGDFVFFWYGVDLTPGTGTTDIFLQLRIGAGLAGTVTGNAHFPPGTGLPRASYGAFCTDQSPNERADAVYTLTITTAGASANGTVNAGEVRAIW